jgi:arylsulfatase A-like enzyme
MLADDVGAGVFGPGRDRRIPTPAIDALGAGGTAFGAGGTAFTQGYATPLCVPTRATLITGRWSQRADNGAIHGNDPPLPLAAVTLAERMRARG